MAAVAFVSASTAIGTITNADSTVSFSVTVAAGESLVVTISGRISANTNFFSASVLFNGSPLTPVRQSSNGDYSLETWVILTPTPATGNVVVTLPGAHTGTARLVVGASLFTNVPQIASPISFGSSASNPLRVPSISLSVALNADAIAFAVCSMGSQYDTDISAGTERYQDVVGGALGPIGAMATATGALATIAWDDPVDSGLDAREGSFMEIFAIITPPLTGTGVITTNSLALHLQTSYLPGKGRGTRDMGGLSLFGPSRKKRGGVRRGRI